MLILLLFVCRRGDITLHQSSPATKNAYLSELEKEVGKLNFCQLIFSFLAHLSWKTKWRHLKVLILPNLAQSIFWWRIKFVQMKVYAHFKREIIAKLWKYFSMKGYADFQETLKFKPLWCYNLSFAQACLLLGNVSNVTHGPLVWIHLIPFIL